MVVVVAVANIAKASTHSYFLGLGYFSENSLGRITQQPSGQTSPLFGTISYPLVFRYQAAVNSKYDFAPSVTYNLLGRKIAGDSATGSLWHLVLPMAYHLSSNWDWTFGVGYLNRTIAGAGGLVQLNNGNSVATFALPGKTQSSQVLTADLGFSYNSTKWRFDLDVIAEGLVSKKRTFDLMLSLSYALGRGS